MTSTATSNDKVRQGTNPENEKDGDDDGNYEHFFWTYTEEPHRSRRMAIIKAHPEVSPILYSIAVC